MIDNNPPLQVDDGFLRTSIFTLAQLARLIYRSYMAVLRVISILLNDIFLHLQDTTPELKFQVRTYKLYELFSKSAVDYHLVMGSTLNKPFKHKIFKELKSDNKRQKVNVVFV